jgi:hypothetical protein
MNFGRNPGAWSVRAGRLLRAALGSAALGSAAMASVVGCTSYSTLKPFVIDCSAEAAYDVQYIYTFDSTTATINFYGSGDHPDASVSAQVEPLTDGARCGSASALVLHSFHNDDWGSLFGIYSFGPRDESAYQGLSFWARAPGNTTKSFTVLFDDTNTENTTTPAVCNVDAAMPPSAVDSGSEVCKNYCTDGGMGMQGTYTDPATGTVVGGATNSAPPPDSCGNEFGTVLQVTGNWQFYTLPFGDFHQAAQPNRVPNAHFTDVGSAPGTYLLTSALMNLVFRMPSEADINLELSHLGFYRPKAASDGAVDAPRDANRDAIKGQ